MKRRGMRVLTTVLVVVLLAAVGTAAAFAYRQYASVKQPLTYINLNHAIFQEDVFDHRGKKLPVEPRPDPKLLSIWKNCQDDTCRALKAEAYYREQANHPLLFTAYILHNYINDEGRRLADRDPELARHFNSAGGSLGGAVKAAGDAKRLLDARLK